MGSYIHQLVKKPILSMKTSQQSYLFNGVRQGGINPQTVHGQNMTLSGLNEQSTSS